MPASILLVALRALAPPFPHSTPNLSKLSIDPATRDSHYDGLDGSNLLIRKTFFLGHAKVMLRSRVAAHRHGGSEMNHEGLSWFEYLIVPSCIIEILIGLLLFLGKHPTSFVANA